MRKLILSALLIWGLTGFTCAVVSLQGGSVVVELPVFDATPTQEIIPTPTATLTPRQLVNDGTFNVNLRASPSLQGSIVDTLPPGGRVRVMDDSRSDDWIGVCRVNNDDSCTGSYWVFEPVLSVDRG